MHVARTAVFMATSATAAAAAMLQTSHLNPTELSELLVQHAAQLVGLMRHTGVQFGVSVHGFSRISRGTKHHLLHWSSEDTMRPPAAHFPIVGEHLSWESIGDLQRVVSKKGIVSLFSPRKCRGRFLGVLRLVRGTDGIYRKSIMQVHKSWSFHSQLTVVGEDGEFIGATAQAMDDLLSKKLVMWLFSYFSTESSKQLTLCQLEMAFPLITVMDMHGRRRFVCDALTRYAGRLLSFYDDRVIYLSDVSVNALPLLSLEELVTVMSMEQSSVAFVFRCQMRHDEVLEALQTILNSWGKHGEAVLASKLVRQAVAILLSHVVTTCALQLPHGLKGWLRLFVIHHMPLLLLPPSASPSPSQLQQPSSVNGLLVSRLTTMLRSSKSQKKSVLVSLQAEVERIMRSEMMAGEATAASAAHAAGGETDVGNIFDSVAPFPCEGTGGVTWKISKGTYRHTVISLPNAPVVKNTELDGTVADHLFSTVLFSGTRLQFSRPLLKSAVETELCLSLNFGKTVPQSVSNDEEELWQTSRKKRRLRKQA